MISRFNYLSLIALCSYIKRGGSRPHSPLCVGQVVAKQEYGYDIYAYLYLSSTAFCSYIRRGSSHPRSSSLCQADGSDTREWWWYLFLFMPVVDCPLFLHPTWKLIPHWPLCVMRVVATQPCCDRVYDSSSSSSRLCPSTAGCSPLSVTSIVVCLLLSWSSWFAPALLCRLAIFCLVVLLISSLSLVATLCSVWSTYCPSFLLYDRPISTFVSVCILWYQSSLFFFLISEHGIFSCSFRSNIFLFIALWAVLSLFVNCLFRDHEILSMITHHYCFLVLFRGGVDCIHFWMSRKTEATGQP